MANDIIEPVAKRVFDGYYRYCDQSGLTELQFLTEEAFKLHERLKKRPGGKLGLHGLDEFWLLKTLRHYSVHEGEFIGEVFGIKQSLAEDLNLDLAKLCLVKKATVNKAINSLKPRDDSEYGREKHLNNIQRIKGQLVDFGGFYNLEPVIYNFIVKVYELLINLGLSIPGEGFKELDTAYKREAYYRYKHYVPLQHIDVESGLLLENLVPLDTSLDKTSGLVDIENDPWKNVGALDLDSSDYKLMGYNDNEYEAFVSAITGIVSRTEESFKVAMSTPNHIGIAMVNDGTTPAEITGFNINQQIALLKNNGIELDEAYFDFGPGEILVLCFLQGKQLWPVILSKHELIEVRHITPKGQKNTIVKKPRALGVKSKIKNKKRKKARKT